MIFFKKLIPKADAEEVWEMPATTPEPHQPADDQVRPVRAGSPDLTHQESSPLEYEELSGGAAEVVFSHGLLDSLPGLRFNS